MLVVLIVVCSIGIKVIKDKDFSGNNKQEEKVETPSNENNSKSYSDDEEEKEEPKKEEEKEEEVPREYSNLIEISINGLKKKVENKESFILLISQSQCAYCALFKPTLNSTLKEYNIEAYYFEFDLLGVDAKNELYKIIDDVPATPLTMFYINGEEYEEYRIRGNEPASVIENRLKEIGYDYSKREVSELSNRK